MHTHFCFLRFLNVKVHSGPWGDTVSLKELSGGKQRPPTCVCSPQRRSGSLRRRSVVFSSHLSHYWRSWSGMRVRCSRFSALTDVNAGLAQPWGWRVDLHIACICRNRPWWRFGVGIGAGHPQKQSWASKWNEAMAHIFGERCEFFWLNAVCLSDV